MVLERLFENMAVTVEAFATCRVASGWRLRLPALEWVTLHFVLQGTGKVLGADGGRRPVDAGSLAVVPPHLVHALESGRGPIAEAALADSLLPPTGIPDHIAGPREEARLIVVCGRVRVAYGAGLGLFDRLNDVLVLDFPDDIKMRGTFEALLDEQREPGPGTPLMTSALLSECLVRVFRRLCQHPDCALPWLLALEDHRLAPVLDEILAQPERQYSVVMLADRVHMSRAAFARRFRESFGRTPMAYVREVRLRRAAGLLRGDGPVSIEAIARRVGFASRSQFSRAFQGLFGCSPTEFRSAPI